MDETRPDDAPQTPEPAPAETRPAWARSVQPVLVGAPATLTDTSTSTAAASTTSRVPRVAKAAVAGVGPAQVRRALLEAGAVLALVLLLLVGATTAVLLSDEAAHGVAPADAVRLAVLALGLGSLGQLNFAVDVGDADAWVALDGVASAVPLLVTAPLVLGWYLFARAARRRSSDVREHVQASVLTGLATGVLLAAVTALAAVRSLPGPDDDLGDQLELLRLSAGIAPLRVALTGAALATATALVARLWPWTRTARLDAGGAQRAIALWAPALGLAVRTLLAALVASTAAGVVVLVVQRDDLLLSNPLAELVALALLVPSAALAVVLLATGTTLIAENHVTGTAGSLSGEISTLLSTADGTSGRSMGVAVGDFPLDLLYVTGGFAVVVLLVALRAGLLRDPRESRAGEWWRTAVAFALVWAGAGVFTTASSSMSGEPRGDLELLTSVLGSFFGIGDGSVRAGLDLTAGPAWPSLLVSGAVIGAVAGAVTTWGPRVVAGLHPRAASAARWLPHRLHPVWALLLTDALDRWGRRVPAVLRRVADETAPTVSDLAQLSVRPWRSRSVSLALGTAAVVGVGAPVAYHVLSEGIYGPVPVAERYAAAFERGDAAALVAAAGVDIGPLLTQDALDAQRAAAPLTRVRLGEVTEDVDGLASAVLTYRIGDDDDEEVPVTLVRGERSGWQLFPEWELSAPLGELHATVPYDTTAVTVNGLAVAGDVLGEDRAAATLSVFPGQVTLVAAVPEPYEARPWTGTVGPVDSVEASIPISISNAGRQQAQEAVGAWLKRCDDSTEMNPAGCPMHVSYAWGDYQDDVRWSFDSTAGSTAIISVTPGGQVMASGGASGTLSYTYGYSYEGLLDPSLFEYDETDDWAVSYEGYVSFASGKPLFSLSSADVT